MDAKPARVVAGLTFAYSVAITVAPRLLARPCGMVNPGGGVPAHVAGLTRSIGVRDAALAAALAVSPVGYPMNVLSAARVVSDAADALWFAKIAPRGKKFKIATVAAGWAALELAALVAANRSRHEVR